MGKNKQTNKTQQTDSGKAQQAKAGDGFGWDACNRFPFLIGFWIIVFAALFLFLQKTEQYHFFFVEQGHMFQYDWPYILSMVTRHGGFVRLLMEYLMQYFTLPYGGALITSILLVCIGILTDVIFHTILSDRKLLILSVFPVAVFAMMVQDVNFQLSGLIAYLLLLLCFLFYLKLSDAKRRFAFSLAAVVLLFWLAGAVAALFATSLLLWELLNNPKTSYLYIFPLLMVGLLALISVRNQWVGEYRFLLLPDGYYKYRLPPERVVYFAWLFLPLVLLVAFFVRKKRTWGKFAAVTGLFLQMLLVAVFAWNVNQHYSAKSVFYKELDYYLRHSMWDRLIARCGEEKMNNYIYKSMLNVALAEKGMLAEKMFSFPQQGVQSIYLEWNRVQYISTVLSEVYFSMGHIAMSQRMAFEANIIDANANPRMMKRLVQTNLIYGDYGVAEKYISKLEKTKFYKKWAQEQRKFLWDNNAVANDSLLGVKRKCIVPENRLSEVYGLTSDLMKIAEHNPKHRATVEYLGLLHLLNKDLDGFKGVLATVFGSEVLPTLPKSFQEAVFVYAEKDTAEWKHYDIPQSMLDRYSDYRNLFVQNRNNPSLSKIMYERYGDTYWYYFMFRKL